MQDVDAAFLNKLDLQANVDTLIQEIDFLKNVYMAVRAHSLWAIQGHQHLAWTLWGLHRDCHTFWHLVSHCLPPLKPVSSTSIYLQVEKAKLSRLPAAWLRPMNNLLRSMIQLLIGESKDWSLGMSFPICWSEGVTRGCPLGIVISVESHSI